MLSDMFLTHRGDSRPWTLWVGLVLSLVVGLTGCATGMTARSRLDVEGPLVVVEKTTTTTTTADGKTTSTVVEKMSQKSAPAGDLELKLAELKGRTSVGVAKAKASVFTYGNSYGSQYGNYGYGSTYNGAIYAPTYSPNNVIRAYQPPLPPRP